MMDRVFLALTIAVVSPACSPADHQQAGPTAVTESGGVEGEQPSHSAALEMLPPPFSAEEIRDEWVPGLRLEMHRWTPSGETFERWRVVSADAEGVEIEFAPFDADGNPAGEVVTRRSAWTELRDHASYPASVASRQRATRATALGELEGWLYALQDPKAGTTSELFFADSLPGAPVEMTVRSGDEVVFRLEQTTRERPATAPGT